MLKVLDFWAQWCAPCRMMKPVIEEVSKIFDIEQVDVDEAVDKAQRYGIKAIPTLIVLKDGKEIARFVGFIGKERLLKTLEELDAENVG
jgi:thioredoxin 1